MRSLLLSLLAFSFILASGCSNTGYLASRRRDFADMGTLCGGLGLGVGIQAGPLRVVPAEAVIDLWGMRGGEFFHLPEFGMDVKVLPMDVGAAWWSSSVFWLENNPRLVERGKAQFVFPLGASSQTLFCRHSNTMPFVSRPEMNWGEENLSLGKYPSHYWGQAEISLALGLSLRVGINAVEIVDFLAGIVAIDPLGDDCLAPKKHHWWHRREKPATGQKPAQTPLPDIPSEDKPEIEP